jgi:hypothetical protein
MKKILFFATILFLLSAVSFLLYNYVFHLEKAEAPNRPSRVPMSAVWKGDFDEGFWIELINADTLEKEYRFKIYKETDGLLAYDGLFRLNHDCLVEKRNPITQILFFEFIEQYKLVINDSCSLDAVLPAFGGELLKTNKLKE